jgi:Protein of unknown function (DUF2695)
MKENAMDTMDPTHPDWVAFCGALSSRLTVEGVGSKFSWNCQHDHRHTRSLLADEWPQIDAEATLELFQEHAGFCDCEVLLNVSDAWENLNGLGEQR